MGLASGRSRGAAGAEAHGSWYWQVCSSDQLCTFAAGDLVWLVPQLPTPLAVGQIFMGERRCDDHAGDLVAVDTMDVSSWRVWKSLGAAIRPRPLRRSRPPKVDLMAASGGQHQTFRNASSKKLIKALTFALGNRLEV
jgi:hypothetical protein